MTGQPARLEDLPLFRRPEPPVVLRTPADYAQLAAFSRDGMKLNTIAARVAQAILDVQHSVAIWEVRIALQGLGEIANDGKEKLDALGGLCTGMGLIGVDTERPPSWAMRFLGASHGNRNIVWVRPDAVATYTRDARRRRVAA